MRTIYSALLYIILPFILLRLLWRRWRYSPAYAERWTERFGYISLPPQPIDLCVHAVSLGEAIAAISLIKALLHEHPHLNIAVTCTTITGSQTIKRQLGDGVYHVYLPYDLPSAVKRFLHRLKPKMLLVMETELWPNLLYYCHKNQIPVLIANARLSEKSVKGYRWIAHLMKSTLSSVSLVAAQSVADADRFILLGLPKEKVVVAGNIKFDVPVGQKTIDESTSMPAEMLADAKASSSRLIWIAASTHPGEDEIVLNAHQQILSKNPHALLILVPRHPERADDVARLCEQERLIVRRRTACIANVISFADSPDWSDDTSVFILDTVGELSAYYAKANVALVCGSLIPHGGHNMLEPIALGVPTLTGPHTRNFAAIAALLLDANAIAVVSDASVIAKNVGELFSKDEKKAALIENGFRVLAENRGATGRHLRLIEELILNYN